MAARFRIDVVIAARDMAAWIGDCLSSLLDQTHRDWRAIVVDDGSRDGTAAVVGCFRDKRIQLIRQANAGVSAARNHGMAAVWGDAVLFLDADDWLAPDALARMAATLAARPDAAAAWGRFALMAGTASWGDRPLRVLKPRLGGPDALAALVVGNRFANGGHVLMRIDAAARAGRFDTRLRFGEDWEYFARLALCGPLLPVPGAAPVLFVRRRGEGAYLTRVADLDAYRPARLTIFQNPDIRARFAPSRLGLLERASEAEAEWIAGRAMLASGQHEAGLRVLRASVRRHKSARRLALLAALHAAAPFRPPPSAPARVTSLRPG
jgi:glycosyltransferase involved in cell wall biosynthesis